MLREQKEEEARKKRQYGVGERNSWNGSMLGLSGLPGTRDSWSSTTLRGPGAEGPETESFGFILGLSLSTRLLSNLYLRQVSDNKVRSACKVEGEGNIDAENCSVLWLVTELGREPRHGVVRKFIPMSKLFFSPFSLINFVHRLRISRIYPHAIVSGMFVYFQTGSLCCYSRGPA